MILDLPVVLDYGPAYEDYNNRIIKTLQQIVADGRKRATIKSAIWTLRTLNNLAYLVNLEAGKLKIENPKDRRRVFIAKKGICIVLLEKKHLLLP